MLAEYGNILDRLEEALRDEPDVYQDLLRLMYNVVEYVLRDHEEFKEEVGSVMGGRVLPLPSDRLREERAEGRAEGRDLKLVSQVCRKLRKGMVVEVIADELERTSRRSGRSVRQRKRLHLIMMRSRCSVS